MELSAGCRLGLVPAGHAPAWERYSDSRSPADQARRQRRSPRYGLGARRLLRSPCPQHQSSCRGQHFLVSQLGMPRIIRWYGQSYLFRVSQICNSGLCHELEVRTYSRMGDSPEYLKNIKELVCFIQTSYTIHQYCHPYCDRSVHIRSGVNFLMARDRDMEKCDGDESVLWRADHVVVLH